MGGAAGRAVARAVGRPLGAGALAAALAALAALAPGGPAAAQPALRVVVVDDATGRPLPAADVTEAATGRRRFVDAGGALLVAWPADGVLRLRVRQLGYLPVTRELRPADAPAGALTVRLRAVAYGLRGVVVDAAPGCPRPGTAADSAARVLALAVLDQLRAAAERYDAFRRAYPFRVATLRQQASFGAGGAAVRVREARGDVASERWDEPYRPGRVLEADARGGFSVPVLTLAALADSAFWTRHCASAAGAGAYGGARVLRLDFEPAPGVRGVEWRGSALVDSATSALRRVEFALAGLAARDPLRRLEGYTDFTAPAPYLVVPDSTVAIWWRGGPAPGGGWGLPDARQVLRATRIAYRGARPPGAAGEPAAPGPAAPR